VLHIKNRENEHKIRLESGEEKERGRQEALQTCLSSFISFSLWILESSFANSAGAGETAGGGGLRATLFTPHLLDESPQAALWCVIGC
jgi:hypothetical protein